MKTVGVKEFKNRATQIIREVRELHEEYLVTVDGKPAAVRRPATEGDVQRDLEAEWADWMQRLDSVAEEVGHAWPEGLSAADAVAQQRR